MTVDQVVEKVTRRHLSDFCAANSIVSLHFKACFCLGDNTIPETTYSFRLAWASAWFRAPLTILLATAYGRAYVLNVCLPMFSGLSCCSSPYVTGRELLYPHVTPYSIAIWISYLSCSENLVSYLQRTGGIYWDVSYVPGTVGSEYFACIVLFQFHNNPMKQWLSWFPCTMEEIGTERWTSLSGVPCAPSPCLSHNLKW